MRILAALAILVVACADPPDTSQTTQALSAIANGSFESADYTGWTLREDPPNPSSGTFAIISEGQTVANGETLFDFSDGVDVQEFTPGLPFTYHATDGTKLAVQLQNGPQDHRMFQSVTLSNCNTVLRWDMAYNNHAGEVGQTFDPIRQFFAVNIRDAADTVLATPFKLVDPAPLSIAAMTAFEADLSAFDGQTVVVDFEQQVQNDFFDIEWDNIRLECQQPPALGSPPLIDFGPVLVGNILPKPFSLDSIGQGDLTITGLDTAPPFGVSASVPVTLPPTQSLQATASFAPAAPGPIAGSIIVHSDDPGGDRTIQVQGVGLAPQIAIGGAVNFGNVPVGSSGTQPLRITNTGNAALTINSIVGVGPFDSTTVPPVTIPVASFVDITLRFTPGAGGNAAGTITINSDAFNAPSVSVDVTGNGTVAGLSFNAAVIDYGDVRLGQPINKDVTVTNTGGATLVISAATTTTPYVLVIGPQLPISLPPNGTTTFTVQFDPAATGVVSRDFVVVSNAATSPDVATLTGNGVVPQASVDVDPLAFGSQRVGTTSATQTVTLTDTGGAPLTISSISVTGPFEVVFPIPPIQIAPGGPQPIELVFKPTAAGQATGTLTIVSDAVNGPTTVTVTGTGIEPVVSLDVATPLAFGNQRLNAPSAVHTVTLTNTGTAPLTVTSVTTTAPFAIVSPVVGGVLQPNDTLPIDITFTPTVVGAAQQDLVFQTDAAGGTSTITMTGTGTVATFDAQPTTLGFGDIRVGTASTAKTLTISNLGGGALTITSIAAPSGVTVTGPAFPVGVLPGANVVFDVVYAPATASSLGGVLTIATSVGNQDVPIAGNGVQAGLTADRTQIDFGKIRIGEASDAQTITLRNVTAAPIAIASAVASDPQFVLDPPPPTTPIAPDQTVTFAIRYVPDVALHISTHVDVTLVGAPSAEVQIDVDGIGTGDAGGCCSSGGTPGSAWLGLLVLGLVRRRRR